MAQIFSKLLRALTHRRNSDVCSSSLPKTAWMFALAVMGIGRLGAISRVLLARAGSVLIYASVGAVTDVEGQLSLEQLRALGFGP